MDDNGNGLLGGVFWVFWLIWLVLILVAGWKMYVKAGQQGWVSLIPIINILGPAQDRPPALVVDPAACSSRS